MNTIILAVMAMSASPEAAPVEKVCAAGYVSALSFDMYTLDGKLPFLSVTVDQRGRVGVSNTTAFTTMRIGYDNAHQQDLRWQMAVKSLSDAFNNRIPIRISQITNINNSWNVACDQQQPIVFPNLSIKWCSSEWDCGISSATAFSADAQQ